MIGILMGSQQRMDTILYEMTGEDNWVGDLNVCVILLQMLIYYPVIFMYMARARKRIMQTSSDAEWLQKQWVYRFQILFFVCFIIVQVCYQIWPRTDTWLIQIINVISMTYLVWCSLTQQIRPSTRQKTWYGKGYGSVKMETYNAKGKLVSGNILVGIKGM